MLKATEAIQQIFDSYGYYLSKERKLPVDNSGNPIPWYTYPAIEWLSCLDFSDKKVWEWGAGNSSLWWGSRSKFTYSVDDDQVWVDKIKSKRSKKQEIYFYSTEHYVNSILYKGCLYDVIVIDGSHRLECAKLAINCVSLTGMIILNNSNWCKNTAMFLRDAGFIQIDFNGLGALNEYAWTTSVFLTKDFNFKHTQIGPLGEIYDKLE